MKGSDSDHRNQRFDLRPSADTLSSPSQRESQRPVTEHDSVWSATEGTVRAWHVTWWPLQVRRVRSVQMWSEADLTWPRLLRQGRNLFLQGITLWMRHEISLSGSVWESRLNMRKQEDVLKLHHRIYTFIAFIFDILMTNADVGLRKRVWSRFKGLKQF